MKTAQTNMKTAQTTLRVSHLTYIRVMDAVIAEVAGLEATEAVKIISAVTAYLHSADNAQARDNEILRRYFDLIDRAALRSARARQAAINRRKANDLPAQASTEAPAEVPVVTPKASIQNSKSKILNSPNFPRPRIKIKHKSLSDNHRRHAKKSFGG